MFQSLSVSLDEVAAVDLGLADDELSAAIMELERLERRLAAERTRLVAGWHARRVWALDGFRSGAAWLAHRCKTRAGAARAVTARARALRWMPVAAAAFAGGYLDEHHVRVLSRLGRARTAEAFTRDEAMLVGWACDLPMADFARAAAYWLQCADPDGVEHDAAGGHAARRAYLSQLLDGIRVLDARFDTVSGAIFSESLEAIETELFEADWAVARRQWGEQVSADKLARTPAERRLDALVEMARRARSAPPCVQPPRPLFTVLVGWETFRGRICELADGTVVTPGQIAPFLTDADIERVVFDTPARVIEVGRRTRCFTGALRRAIEVRDRFCTQPGCHEPAAKCDIDHTHPYAQGGDTTQDNGNPACRTDNHLRQHGFTIERHPTAPTLTEDPTAPSSNS